MKKLFLFAFILFSCSSDGINDPAVNESYRLELKNSFDEMQLTQINSTDFVLNVTSGNQIFTIDNLPNGSNNVSVTLNFSCMNKQDSRVVNANLNKGQTTVVELTKYHRTAGGCIPTFVVSYQ